MSKYAGQRVDFRSWTANVHFGDIEGFAAGGQLEHELSLAGWKDEEGKPLNIDTARVFEPVPGTGSGFAIFTLPDAPASTRTAAMALTAALNSLPVSARYSSAVPSPQINWVHPDAVIVIYGYHPM